jgi:Helicase HerA, central domain
MTDARSQLLAVAYTMLGLRQRDEATAHLIGTFRIIDTPERVIDAVVESRLEQVRQELEEAKQELPEHTFDPDDKEAHERYDDFYLDHYFLDYERYLYALKNKDRYLDRLPHESPEIRFYFNDIHSFRMKPTREAWLDYLRQAVPDFYAFLTKDIPLLLPHQETQEHTYIVAATGAGKSTLLKKLIWSYMTNTNAAIVIIEPTGELSREVAEFKEFAEGDQLVYLAGDLDLEQTFCINPFEIPGMDPSDTSLEALRMKRVMADEIYEALSEIIGEGEGSTFSLNMKALLKPCIVALLDYPGATLRELKRFMDTGDQELVQFAKTLSHHPDLPSFFMRDFPREHYTVTKNGISAKLQILFGTGTFAQLTCGKSTVNLEREIEQRKIIIFDLNKAVVAGAGAPLGRLIVSMLKEIATRRARIEKDIRVPTHVIIDECSDYICPSIREIIQEKRKFLMMLTLCQTEVGAAMPQAVKSAVTGSTNVKLMGPIGADHWSSVASLVNLRREEFEDLRVGEFYLSFGRGNPTIKFKTGKEFLGNAHSMTSAHWKNVRARQLNRYYLPVRPLNEVIPPERAERPRAAVRTRRAVEVMDVHIEEDVI